MRSREKRNERISSSLSLARQALVLLLLMIPGLWATARSPASDFRQRLFTHFNSTIKLRERTGESSSAADGFLRLQIPTTDKPNKEQSAKSKPKAKPAHPAVRVQPPSPSPSGNILPNITLEIITSPKLEGKGVSVTLFARDGSVMLRPHRLTKLTAIPGGYAVSLSTGIDLGKQYWVLIESGTLSGEALVPRPREAGDHLPLQIGLYPKVDITVTVIDEQKVRAQNLVSSLVRKADAADVRPDASIPYPLRAATAVTFSKGLDPESDYLLFINDEKALDIAKDEFRNGQLIKMVHLRDREATIKVLSQSGPVDQAGVRITTTDFAQIDGITSVDGSTLIGVSPDKIAEIEIRCRGCEDYRCDLDGPIKCPAANKQGLIEVHVQESNSVQWLVTLLKSAVIPSLMLLLLIVIALGLKKVSRLKPAVESPPLRISMAMQYPRAEEGTKKTPAPEHRPLESNPVIPNPDVDSLTPVDTVSDSSLIKPKAYSVPTSLSQAVAKEAYRQWARGEKLSRAPRNVDLMLNNSPNKQSLRFRETRDPGSKFIVFTNGADKGWLFPNPAQSVLQTDVNQTWRLLFKGLSKEEFKRKKERLNPIEARRVSSGGSRDTWAASPHEYHFD